MQANPGSRGLRVPGRGRVTIRLRPPGESLATDGDPEPRGPGLLDSEPGLRLAHSVAVHSQVKVAHRRLGLGAWHRGFGTAAARQPPQQGPRGRHLSPHIVASVGLGALAVPVLHSRVCHHYFKFASQTLGSRGSPAAPGSETTHSIFILLPFPARQLSAGKACVEYL